MREKYTYTDFKGSMRRWWFLIVLGIIICASATLLMKGKYKAEAIITVKNSNIYKLTDQAKEIDLYKIRLNQIGVNVHATIVPKVLEEEHEMGLLDKVNKNLEMIENVRDGQMIENVRDGQIKLIYSSKNKKEAETMVNKIAQETVDFFSIPLDKNTFSIENKGIIGSEQVAISERVGYMILGGFLGAFLMMGFIIFLELLFRF